jgi:hypothetical protein
MRRSPHTSRRKHVHHIVAGPMAFASLGTRHQALFRGGVSTFDRTTT